MASPTASIIIRCYNEVEYLGKLLHGISEQTVDDYETILVDSGSTDGTLEVAEEFGVDTISYIEPEDFSFGRALNYGIEEADGEFCVIASAHVYPRRADWLERLLGELEADNDVALVYGKQRGNEVTTFSENQIFKQWFPEYDIEHQPHPFCNNANAAIRREVWKEFPYDEHLTGLEDVDWAKRVQEAGHEISYVSEAKIIHVHDETPREVLNRYRREAYAHKEIMPEQSFSFTDFVWLSGKNILSDFRAALEGGCFRKNIVEIPKFRFLQFWGTYRGFTKRGPISDNLWQRFFYPDRESYPPHQASNNVDSTTEEASEIEYPDSGELIPR